jgi:hypothetical protein
MTKAKSLTIALLTATSFAAPALAAGNPTAFRHVRVEAHASAASVDHHGTCIRAPRVGAFATAPWTNPPCEPNTAY